MVRLNENSTIQHAADIVGQNIDNETILVLTQQGQVKVINEIGGLIWELSKNATTFADILRVIVAEYNIDSQTARQDAKKFIQELAEIGALRIT